MTGMSWSCCDFDGLGGSEVSICNNDNQKNYDDDNDNVDTTCEQSDFNDGETDVTTL